MANILSSCSVCPTGCTENFLPPLNPDQDCFQPNSLVYSQVCGIFFLPCNEGVEPSSFTDADLVTWAAAQVDNADTTGTKARYLVVEGGIGASAPVQVTLPKRKTKNASRTFTLDATVRNLSDLNFDFIRQLQGGCSCFKVYIETVGGRLFSYGTEGITVDSYNADIILGAGVDDFESATIQLTFSNCAFPERACSPFAE
jgi:hypothetical protein